MSDFAYDPTYGAQVARAPRVRIAAFGDGYDQRVADGINTNPEDWDVSFVRPKSEIDTIETFLTTKAGVTSFTWTPYGHSEIRVVCAEWRRIKSTAGVDTLTARFRQVFES
jgi:phage-related protein